MPDAASTTAPIPHSPSSAHPIHRIAILIPAAGKSTRFGRNKLTEPLAGRPVLARTLAAFLSRPDVAQVIIAATDPASFQPLLPTDPRIHLCPGGDHRAHSVRNALAQVDPTIDWIAVHDAARPLVSQPLIDRTFAAAAHYGAAAPAMPVALTIKQATGPLPAQVSHTLPRHDLWALQTPQVMRRADLADAFARCPLPLEQITDDMQLLELTGRPVFLIPGDERNLKITTPLDLHLATLLLSSTRDD